MYSQNDPWAWLNEEKQVSQLPNIVAPLSHSSDQPPPPVVTKDPNAQFLNQYALGKSASAAEKGLSSAGNILFGSQTPAPVVEATVKPVADIIATAPLAEAAPAAASAAAEGIAATTAAEGIAATNSWNPIGWAAMAYLGGKALKLW